MCACRRPDLAGGVRLTERAEAGLTDVRTVRLGRGGRGGGRNDRRHETCRSAGSAAPVQAPASPTEGWPCAPGHSAPTPVGDLVTDPLALALIPFTVIGVVAFAASSGTRGGVGGPGVPARGDHRGSLVDRPARARRRGPSRVRSTHLRGVRCHRLRRTCTDVRHLGDHAVGRLSRLRLVLERGVGRCVVVGRRSDRRRCSGSAATGRLDQQELGDRGVQRVESKMPVGGACAARIRSVDVDDSAVTHDDDRSDRRGGRPHAERLDRRGLERGDRLATGEGDRVGIALPVAVRTARGTRRTSSRRIRARDRARRSPSSTSRRARRAPGR